MRIDLFVFVAKGVGCVFAELMLRRPFMGGPFLRGGHTGKHVTEDSGERLRYRGEHSTRHATPTSQPQFSFALRIHL